MRIRRHEHAAGRDRIGVAVELAVALGGRDVHGPVAGAGNVRVAALLERLHRAGPCRPAHAPCRRSTARSPGNRSRGLRRRSSPSARRPIRAAGSAAGSGICARPWRFSCRFLSSSSGRCPCACSATRRARIIFTWSSISRRAPAASRISISAASSRCTSSTRRATCGVSVRFSVGHETCCSERSCVTSTRLCEASATARWKSRHERV